MPGRKIEIKKNNKETEGGKGKIITAEWRLTNHYLVLPESKKMPSSQANWTFIVENWNDVCYYYPCKIP